MNNTERETYRERLLALLLRLRGDVSQLSDEGLHKGGGEGSGSLSNVPIHMADLGTDNYEQEFTLGLLQNEAQLIGEIEAAFQRIHQGTFGQCEECQRAIPKARLQALVYTRHCLDCARKLEQGS